MERNYDVGNHKLLAVKLALEEWRHWLEGAQQPFVVWTDHKNLEYISSAKWLNFKPDTLSQQFVGEEGPAKGPSSTLCCYFTFLEH